MSSQLEIGKSLDALLILGGEEEDLSRRTHAYLLHENNPSLPIIICGGHSNYDLNTDEKAESERVKDYLASMGIDEEFMYTETESQHTLGNIVLAQPLIEMACNGDSRKIGLITDPFHMKRGIWTAKRVFPPGYEMYPLPTSKEVDIFGRINEAVVMYLFEKDLNELDIHPGEQEKWEQYVQQNPTAVGPRSQFVLNTYHRLRRMHLVWRHENPDVLR